MKAYILFSKFDCTGRVLPTLVFDDKEGLIAYLGQYPPADGVARHSIHEVEIDPDAGFQSTEAFELDEYGNRMVDSDLKTIEAAKMDSPKVAGPVNYREYA